MKDNKVVIALLQTLGILAVGMIATAIMIAHPESTQLVAVITIILFMLIGISGK